MIALTLLFVLVLAAWAAVVFLLGFRLGGDHWLAELHRVQAESALAERQLHDLTRQAFITMAEQVEQRRGHARP